MLIKIYKAVSDTWFLWLIAGILILWGYYNDGWIRIGFGCLFIYLAIRTSIDDYKLDRKIDKWFKNHEGKTIFFYPTKKEIQNRIKEEVVPLPQKDVLQVYYDGPKLIGDTEDMNFIISRIMFFRKELSPNRPSIFRVENGDFKVICNLNLLMNIIDEGFDLEAVKRKINQTCG